MLEVRTVEELKEAILIGDKIYIHPGVYDIVNYLSPKNPSKIYWIYNIFDRWYDYPEKYPYLEKALRAICQKEKIKIKAGYAR